MIRRGEQIQVLPIAISLGVAFRLTTCFVLIVWVLKAAVVEAFFVPSRSMLPTLKSMDYILVPKFAYGLHIPWMKEALFDWSVPGQGDIVVFTRPDDPETPENESEQNMVKRVVALPNTTVEIVGTSVFVDGKKLNEPYAVWSAHSHDGMHFGPVKVPKDHVFLLGDNRDASIDSRSWSDPFVSIRRIKGRAVMVYWSGINSGRAGTIL